MAKKKNSMLKKLVAFFEGKKILITHGNEYAGRRSVRGICKAVHDSGDHFEIELKNGDRYGFLAETVTADSVEGKLEDSPLKSRKIQVRK